MMNTSNFKQRTLMNSKYSIEPLNCSHIRHENMENLQFDITQVMPVHNYGESFRFVEGCLYVLPKCYPIIEYALLSRGNLILFQVSVMSLADHQEKRRKKTKKLTDWKNEEVEGILKLFSISNPKGSKEKFIDAIQQNVKREVTIEGNKVSLKNYIQNMLQISLDSSSLPFWDLLWNEQQIGKKLWTNAFGTQSSLDR
jgi:hypothetical protein